MAASDAASELIGEVAVRAKAQGFAMSPNYRWAIEQYAIKKAIDYHNSRGYEVKNKSANKPYDLIGRKRE